VPVLAVVTFNFVGGVAYQGILQQMKKKAVTSMFGKYVSDNLVQKMVAGELEIDVEGKTKELTVLFSDIRGFTRLSEGLSPDVVGHILHVYFSRMISTIFEHGGTLDKLMGDAIMAFFGDPEDMPEHPRKAAEAALAMMVALEEMKRTSDIPAVKDFAIGIGLNSGLVTVGNLGSDEYFDYTVIGDNVNLGSRLEGLNGRSPWRSTNSWAARGRWTPAAWRPRTSSRTGSPTGKPGSSGMRPRSSARR
jgi:adenylate cyclase